MGVRIVAMEPLVAWCLLVATTAGSTSPVSPNELGQENIEAMDGLRRSELLQLSALPAVAAESEQSGKAGQKNASLTGRAEGDEEEEGDKTFDVPLDSELQKRSKRRGKMLKVRRGEGKHRRSRRGKHGHRGSHSIRKPSKVADMGEEDAEERTKPKPFLAMKLPNATALTGKKHGKTVSVPLDSELQLSAGAGAEGDDENGRSDEYLEDGEQDEPQNTDDDERDDASKGDNASKEGDASIEELEQTLASQLQAALADGNPTATAQPAPKTVDVPLSSELQLTAASDEGN